ncbi:protein CAF40-like [Punica granatum]|uniref:Protein CAF40-like n=1 Tax=Punica granatum TaxID=22663 RepID=A0A6P8C3Y3_PUNGR|nr:protein CAF40-like [Punica granatum]
MAALGHSNSKEFPNLPEEPWDWEEISLNLLRPSDIYSGLFCISLAQRNSGRKRHRLRWMVKPRAVPQLILKLQDPTERESALRMLSSYLFEKREEEPENYYMVGLLLYYSCGTMTLLIQVQSLTQFSEHLMVFLRKEAAMRLINAIILFQCIAANKLTRQKIVSFQMANLLVPLVMHQSPLKVYDNVRAVALSVIGIICQDRELEMIDWAIQSDILEVCWLSIETGNELTKVVGLHILESILQTNFGRSWLLTESNSSQQDKLLKTLGTLVKIMAAYGSCLPRLLFHIIRCYILLCRESRGYDIVKEAVASPLLDGTFSNILKA